MPGWKGAKVPGCQGGKVERWKGAKVPMHSDLVRGPLDGEMTACDQNNFRTSSLSARMAACVGKCDKREAVSNTRWLSEELLGSSPACS